MLLKENAAELLQQSSGTPRFGNADAICEQSNRETSETQEPFF